MTDRPITPTRIIPAGAPLPDRPPEPDEVPPWRAPAATPQAPDAQSNAHSAPHPARTPPVPPEQPPTSAHPHPAPLPPAAIEVRVVFAPIETEPEPSRWERLWAWVTGIARPWKICFGLAAAAAPIPGVGHSLGGVWAYCVDGAREQFGAGWAYGIALVPLYLCGRIVVRTGSLRALAALGVCLIGVTGAVHLFDPVTALTGVHPR